ncbi:hypothetical protein JEZ13_08960 [bacterium]|nr:hypothetical protein [bacterium]
MFKEKKKILNTELHRGITELHRVQEKKKNESLSTNFTNYTKKKKEGSSQVKWLNPNDVVEF